MQECSPEFYELLLDEALEHPDCATCSCFAFRLSCSVSGCSTVQMYWELGCCDGFKCYGSEPSSCGSAGSRKPGLSKSGKLGPTFSMSLSRTYIGIPEPP